MMQQQSREDESPVLSFAYAWSDRITNKVPCIREEDIVTAERFVIGEEDFDTVDGNTFDSPTKSGRSALFDTAVDPDFVPWGMQ